MLHYCLPYWFLLGWFFGTTSWAASIPQEAYSKLAPQASRSLLLDGAHAGSNLVVVGARGHILLSEDRGHSWQQMEVPVRSLLTAVHFDNKNLGWAVGHDAVILRTTDGGRHWTKVYSAPEEERPLLDVWFQNAEHGFALGAYGFFLETKDGGTHWTSRTISEDDYHLNQLLPAATGALYIAAELGNIYRSDDQGKTWQALPSPYEGSFFGVLPLDDRQLLVMGLRGHLFYSKNAGQDWQAILTGTQALLHDGLRLDDGQIVLVGRNGVVLVSRDQGQHFQQYPQKNRQGIASLLQIPKQNTKEDPVLVLIGEFGVTLLHLPSP